MSPSLQNELKKRKKFDSVEQEAMLALMRTTDLLENRLARLFRDFGVTLTQYNVLRILRGEGKPMPCLEIAARMIQVAPAITRVVDQLLALELVTKTQSDSDRRVFEIELTPAAVNLLKKMDQPVLDLHASLMASVKKSDLRSMIHTLEEIRGGVPE